MTPITIEKCETLFRILKAFEKVDPSWPALVLKAYSYDPFRVISWTTIPEGLLKMVKKDRRKYLKNSMKSIRDCIKESEGIFPDEETL